MKILLSDNVAKSRTNCKKKTKLSTEEQYKNFVKLKFSEILKQRHQGCQAFIFESGKNGFYRIDSQKKIERGQFSKKTLLRLTFKALKISESFKI